MKSSDKNDRLDELLFLAASECGEAEIAEYKAECEKENLTPDFLKEIPIASSVSRVKTRLSFKKRFIAYFAAAALTVTLAVVGIAGRNGESAVLVERSLNDEVLVSFDLSGIKPEKKSFPNLNESALEGFLMEELTDSDGKNVMRYTSDSGETTLNILPLTDDTEIRLAGEGFQSVDIVLCEKYNGKVFERNADGYTETAIVWNDGDFAFLLSIPLPSEVALEVAASFYERVSN